MQIRKLIRLLKEAEEKIGSCAEVFIDTNTYQNWHGCWDYDKINSFKIDSCLSVDRDGLTKKYSQEQNIIILNKFE